MTSNGVWKFPPSPVRHLTVQRSPGAQELYKNIELLGALDTQFPSLISESAKHGNQIPQTERVSIISLVILVPFAPLRMTNWADMFWTAILGISEICGFQTCALYILESQMHMDPCPEGAKCDHPRDGKERGWQLRHYAILQHVSVVIQCYSVSFVEQPRNLDLQRIWLDQHEYPQKEIVRVRLCSRSPQIFAW